MNRSRLLPQIAGLTLLLLLLNACGQTPTPVPPTGASSAQDAAKPAEAVPTHEKAKLFSAITFGYYVGYLATTYDPGVRDLSNTQEARTQYSMVVKGAAGLLGIKLDPDPDSLQSAGRGGRQYDAIVSYFDASLGSDQSISCVNFSLMFSNVSGQLIIFTYEAYPAYGDASAAQLVKQALLERLSAFSALANTASVMCKEDGYTELSAMLNTIDNNSQDWGKRISSMQGDQIIDAAKSLRDDLDKWMQDLQVISSK